MARRVWYNSLSFAPKGVEDEVGQRVVSLTAGVRLR